MPRATRSILPGRDASSSTRRPSTATTPTASTDDGIDWEVPDPETRGRTSGTGAITRSSTCCGCSRRPSSTCRARSRDDSTLEAFTYADVPYRIRPYDELVRDPKSTIEFDDGAARRGGATSRASSAATAGCSSTPTSRIVVVTLLEKLLVSALAKLSNLVPDGGIWMNTQRPEWNDANNALVGYGLSMVTLFHLRRYLAHLRSLVAEHGRETSISAEVVSWFEAVHEVLASTPSGGGADADRRRRDVMDRLGRAASDYRSAIYASGFSGAVGRSDRRRSRTCAMRVGHLDETIRGSKRADGLYSRTTSCCPRRDRDRVAARQMLEGQVAALSSGVLSAGRQADLLDALFASALVRHDLGTFLLAPAGRLPGFLDKNVVDPDAVDGNPLLSRLVASDERTVIRADPDGTYRFAPDLTTEPALRSRLERLGDSEPWASLVDLHRDAVLEIYESVFNHRAYIGRSGSMHAYEGVGSIYWHMVTKLLLGVQEAISDALQRGDDDGEVTRLCDAYWRVRSGLGVNKSAAEFGAVPIDPYSHTPAHAGAQQPGMTGAVKEEILARRAELGVAVVRGHITFDELLLPRRRTPGCAGRVDGLRCRCRGRDRAGSGRRGRLDALPGADRGRGRGRRSAHRRRVRRWSNRPPTRPAPGQIRQRRDLRPNRRRETGPGHTRKVPGSRYGGSTDRLRPVRARYRVAPTGYRAFSGEPTDVAPCVLGRRGSWLGCLDVRLGSMRPATVSQLAVIRFRTTPAQRCGSRGGCAHPGQMRSSTPKL